MTALSSNLVHQTSTTTGTGAQTLTAVNGKRSFLTAFGTGGTNLFWYFISHQTAAEWEFGTGHENAGTLVRDTVIGSSNANAAVSFTSGVKDITSDIPYANQAVLTNAGQLLLGLSATATVGGDDASLEVAADVIATGWNISLPGYGNHANGAEQAFYKTRGASVVTNTILQAEDEIGGLYFYGADGVDSVLASIIKVVVDGTPGVNDMPTRIEFFTTPDGSDAYTERMRINSAGSVYINQTVDANPYGSGFAKLAIATDNNNGYNLGLVGYENGSYGGGIAFSHTRNASPSGHTIVHDGDTVGFLDFVGSDGSVYCNVANIFAQVDGTPGSLDMPGRLVFSTTSDGTATTTERMRINSKGAVSINGATPYTDVFLAVHGIGTSRSSFYVGDYDSNSGGANRNVYGLFDNYNNDGYGDGLSIQYARGTRASPAIVQSGDSFGVINWWGYDGVANKLAAQINVLVDGTPGVDDIPGVMVFGTTYNGTAAPAESMRIDSNGAVLINGTIPYPDIFFAVHGGNLSTSKSSFLIGDYDTGSGGANRNVYGGFDNFNNDGYGDGLAIQYARGTRASPAIVHLGDGLGYLNWTGYDGTTYQTAGRIQVVVGDTPGASDMPGLMLFHIHTAGGGLDTLDERFRIFSDGVTATGFVKANAAFIERDSATTNTVTSILRLTSTSTGTPANGIGVGIEFEVETAAANKEIGATMAAVVSDVTAAAEDFDIVWKTMAAGAAAAERMRLYPTVGGVGGLKLDYANAGGEVDFTAQNTATGAGSFAGYYLQCGDGSAQSAQLYGSHSDGSTTLTAFSGYLQIGTETAAKDVFFYAGNGYALTIDGTNQNVGVGASITEDRALHVEREYAATNTVTPLLRLTTLSSGSPAAGIGAGIEFEVETAAGNNEIGAIVEAYVKDATSTAEDFGYRIKTMTKGQTALTALDFSLPGTVYPQGHIFALTMSNAADTANDITIAAGEAVDETGVWNMTLAANTTKRIDAGWAVGDAGGGLNTGAVAAGWYEVILIGRADTRVVDVMFSTTGNRATLPTGYTHKRRIGWVKRNAGNTSLEQFTQKDDHVTWTTQFNDVSASVTTTAAAVTLTAPPNSIARFRAGVESTTSVNANAVIVFSEIAEGNVTPAITTGIGSLGQWDLATGASAGHFELRVDGSSQIEHDAQVGSGTFDISTFGYIDNRRRMSAI